MTAMNIKIGVILRGVAAGLAALGMVACQTGGRSGNTDDMLALEDYPFDEHGNYIEGGGAKRRTQTVAKVEPEKKQGGGGFPGFGKKKDPPPPPTMPEVASLPPLPPGPPAGGGGSNYQPIPDTPPAPPVVADSPSQPSGGTGTAKKPSGGTGTAKKPSGVAKSGGSSKPAGGTYVVVKGDTLSKIAKRHGTSVSAIRATNGLRDADFIRVGQKLKMPSGVRAKNVAGSGATGASGSTTYTVKSGDSLWTIARANRSSVEAIKRANGLKSDVVRPGQKLKIPR